MFFATVGDGELAGHCTYAGVVCMRAYDRVCICSKKPRIGLCVKFLRVLMCNAVEAVWPAQKRERWLVCIGNWRLRQPVGVVLLVRNWRL